MRLNIFGKLISFLALFLFIVLPAKGGQTVLSPNGKISVELHLEKGKIFYSAKKNGKTILNKSQLGFVLKDGNLDRNFKIRKVKHSTFDENWEQPWGEEITVRNHYNEMVATVEENSKIKKIFLVKFRVFNDGFGFRYEFPEQKNLKDFVIMDELTEFSFPEDHQSWSLSYKAEFYEGLYRTMNISKLDTISTPLTLETKEGNYLSIHEANLTDYASLNLYPKNNSTTLKAFLTPWSTGEKVFMTARRITPWRTVIVGDKPADLLLSRLMLNLNEPNKIVDTSWITPGRYIGIWWGMHMKKNTWEMGPIHGATTENVMKYIDFAAKHNFSGVLVEGWNKGWEDWKSFDFLTSYPDFDIRKITDYAKQKNVELIGHHETGGNTLKYESQMDLAFSFYKDYGINIVKTGYVGGLLDGKEQHGSQYGIRHYRKAIETAAKHRIMIDNHEPAMPTGLQRTFPNLMTQEAVRGQEWDAWSDDGGNPANHTTIIPFTRGLAGPMDFTPGTFNFTNTALPNTKVKTTLAKQLALSVVIFSPLQMASDMIENYENNPAFEFITSTPTTWGKTVVPDAEIGEYVTIARKDVKSENWFLGSITNENARNLIVSLNFLDEGATYDAKIFSDGPIADFEINPYPVDIKTITVNSLSVLNLKLGRGGGTAIIFIRK